MLYARLDEQTFAHPVSKVVCVGRNYADHAAELNNPIPETPLLFIKPASCAVDLEPAIRIPTQQGEVHHELEIALLIGRPLYQASVDTALRAIAGIGLGIDLTLRDVQSQLKSKGHPWERAKAFPDSCPLSRFVSAEQVTDWQELDLKFWRNGQLQQHGRSADMLFSIAQLVSEASTAFGLEAGDVVLTGTPAGVGPLRVGDELQLALNNWLDLSCKVEACDEPV
ncbi:isomerase/hydrolase [Bacterioplanes sanyensis]|uniref:Isomerase/hydrolase n=1 Tax=Bacterioplanes sanyensis TaxID=1249553 RepID=A0A222FJF4_9GAMM|nr:fumarylacetoacetate hydrolase family protein [Bacterioplanes sanyensis]ASP38869.1 isomerase/hydrolase [Bacterioplanes sanyensis]